MTHTPTPWELHECYEKPDGTRTWSINAAKPNGAALASVKGASLHQPDPGANAALIVRAVNHHDELVGVLKATLSTMANLYDPVYMSEEQHATAADLADTINTVLAKVRG